MITYRSSMPPADDGSRELEIFLYGNTDLL